MRRGIIFDLDGVLTDTAQLHFQSWATIARNLGRNHDPAANDRLRGLSREESLRIFLGDSFATTPAHERQRIMDAKNAEYLRLVEQMSPADTAPRGRELIEALRERGAGVALASSSRNARRVLDKLALTPLFDAIIDGNDTPRSKPDPALFLLAAELLDTPPGQCVVVEDAESGVAAALAAGMEVVGIGPASRLAQAAFVVESVADLTPDDLLSLIPPEDEDDL